MTGDADPPLEPFNRNALNLLRQRVVEEFSHLHCLKNELTTSQVLIILTRRNYTCQYRHLLSTLPHPEISTNAVPRAAASEHALHFRPAPQVPPEVVLKLNIPYTSDEVRQVEATRPMSR